MPDRVISDTSPLYYLHRLGVLDLLHHLYKQIVIPQAVLDELQAGARQGDDVPDIRQIDWIEVRSVHLPRILGLVTDLGAGEAQVLALALEDEGSLAIVDDGLARRIARAQNLRITGTAGVLLKAKQSGHLDALSPLLDKLDSLGFRLAEDVRITILRLAGEVG